MNKPTQAISRRDFLSLATKTILAACGLIAVGGVGRFLAHPEPSTGPETFDLGLATDYPPGSRTVLAKAKAVLIHGPNGFQAISLTCTHLGCEVRPSNEGFACPCHGSLFDQNGGLIRGPAVHPLRLLKIEQAGNGHLILHAA